MSAPIALFTYNRPEHTQRTVDALAANRTANECDLFIFCDGARNVDDHEKVSKVRKFVREVTGFKSVTIISHETNSGLANSIIKGISHVLHSYDRIIVLEDDLVVSPFFLEYMNTCLTAYRKKENVFSIGGWSPPNLLKCSTADSVVFIPRVCTWGWGTWKDRWESVDWDMVAYNEIVASKAMQKDFNRGGEDLFVMLKAQHEGHINSWGIRFAFSQFLQGKLTAFPIQSYVRNIGCDGSGVHCSAEIFQQENLVSSNTNLVLPAVVQEDASAIKLSRASYGNQSLLYRMSTKAKQSLRALIACCSPE